MKSLQISTTTKFKIDKRKIHQIIKYLANYFEFEITNLEIHFINSQSILAINTEYLNHNYVTDIVTLDYSQNPKEIDAELYISYEVANENALIYKNSLNVEIIRLIVHGVLHLQNYNDTDAISKKKMEKIENSLVNELFAIELIKEQVE